MRIWLKVPYEAKDQAKKLGARWDVARRTWYVDDPEDVKPFMQWIDERLKQPHKRKQ